MKKLMVAAVLATASVAFADIASNVVGYKNNDLQNGATMVAATFVPVTGDEAIDLLDIKVGGTFTSGQINIQTLTTAGLRDKSYTWMWSNKQSRWYWDDGVKDVVRGEVTFEPGTGLWVQGVDGAQITFAGAVSTADRVIALKGGAIATGNMTAVAIDLLDIIPGGTYKSGEINIQTLDANGMRDKSYTWMWSNKQSRWYWDDGIKDVVEGEVKFEPGKGLWIQGVEGATLTFPGPTL